MKTLEDFAVLFWNAASVFRLAADRDRRIAAAVLVEISETAPISIRQRAIETLKGIENERLHEK